LIFGISGLGKVGGGENVGFFLHPMMVIDANDQTCLGLSAIKTWVRDDSDKSKYKSKPIEDKESYRWVEVANQSKIVLSSARQITVIADRESDIYEEWYRVPDEKTHLIIRACYDRNLTNQQSLFDYIGQQQPAQTYEFEVKARPKKNNTKRSSHIATARLGGWKGYKSESPPGPITILRGLRKFEAILEGYEVFKMCA
jgi:hypothetical protein